MQDIARLFTTGGPLARTLPGFQPRAGQAYMAEAVADAIERRETLIVEAGTGTGKTFAYLAPALAAGCRTIVSTGTRALQDQLFHRDLPTLGAAMGRPVTAALLKGRANYLCLERLESTQATPALARDLERIHSWRYRTRTGDRREVTDVAEDSGVWPLVTSTTDNCLGQSCPHYKDCHVVRARREAQEADLVVVNHHLLLADLAMKEAGFAEFLPGADLIVLDEAHQVPDLATRFFGVTVSSRELERLTDELRAATLPYAQSATERSIDKLQTAIRELRAAVPTSTGRHDLGAGKTEFDEPMSRLKAAIADTAEVVTGLADNSAQLARLADRLCLAGERLASIHADDCWDGFRWVEVSARSVKLNLTPFDVADRLAAIFDAGDQAWVLTSATLAIGEDFSHFTTRIGLPGARAIAFPSPYDLQTKGLVYLPPGLPPPGDRTHTKACLSAVLPLLTATSGGVFFLFTSHRALREARQLLEDDAASLEGRPCLVQGDAPRDDLLRRFRGAGNAVLLGTGSFWEGVDVRGPALTVVAIDKLPFASPSDPMMMARLEHIRRLGGNGFMDHQLPLAALALKQGAGRLHRDASDYGVIVLCDPRVTTKPYGKTFLDCLSPMPSTCELGAVKDFLLQCELAAAPVASGTGS